MKLPYHINLRYEVILWAVMAVSAAISPYFYSRFPTRVVTHWNIAGQPDGWSGPAFAAFFFPALIIAMYLLMTLLPLADPQRDRYTEFSRPYFVIRASLVIFMSALYVVASMNGLGYEIPINKVVPLGIGLLFVILGNFLPKVRKNWFVGVRTPWTLASEDVWQKTHRMSGKMFVFGGIALALTTFLPSTWSMVILIGVLVAITFGTVAYSWLLWRKR